jgi:hypothetical protein|tara:strand:+ start:2602 stop:3381 length:780 start_codon:yes stop_codon:yes gene_type:complete
MEDLEANDNSLESLFNEAKLLETSGAETVKQSLSLASDVKGMATEVSEAESEFIQSLQIFQAEQENIILNAKSMLPDQCKKCQSYIHSKKDKSCASNKGSCFSCFTAEQSQITMAAEAGIEKSNMELIATMDLSDYEEWLFDDEMGRRSIARIVAKMQSQGYEYKPWQVSIGAAAWSKDRYTNTSLEDTRYLVERLQPNVLVQYIPESVDNITSVIDSIKRAEEIRGINIPSKSSKGHWPVIGGIAGISILIPYLMKRK